MFPLFDHRLDHRLTDPGEAAVRDALKRVCAAANGKRKTGTVNLSDDAKRVLAKRVVAEAEGVYSLGGTYSITDTARLGLAWWTAPGGRKLVRIRAWRGPYQSYQADYDHPSRVADREWQSRPAVWHLDPERMTMVEADGETRCVAVCGCGATGSPETLAWAGGMCGPCRDRVEEHGPASVSHEPAVLADAEFTPRRALATTDGRVVAVGDNRFRVWDRTTGALRASRGEPGTYSPLGTISPDGRYVLLDGENREVLFHDLTTGTRGPALADGSNILSRTWTGRPGEVVFQWWHGRDLRLVTITEDGSTRESEQVAPPIDRAILHAIHPEGPRAVFSENGHVAVCRVSQAGELTPLHHFQLGKGQHDRTGIWNSHGPGLVRFTADGERLLFASQSMPDQHLELWNPAKPRALLQATFPARVADAQFSPDGEHLFLLAEDGSVFVCHPGLITHVRARLRWHVGSAHSLTVSPDGRTLVTTGDEGVKLWPVARLLEVL